MDFELSAIIMVDHFPLFSTILACNYGLFIIIIRAAVRVDTDALDAIYVASSS